MRRRWNREKALFAIALVLFAWTAAKLGMLLTRREAAPTTPTVVAPAIHHGDPRLGDFLRPPALDAELGRGSGRSFGGPDKPPPPPPENTQRIAKQTKNAGDDKKPDNDDDGPGKDDKANDGRLAKGGDKGGDGKEARDTLPPPPPPAPGLTLVAVVRTDGLQPRTQAVVRDDQTGQLLRLSVGEFVLDDLRLDTITDDSVTLVGVGGRRHVLRGRFEVQYGH